MSEPAPLTIAVFQCMARDKDAAARLDRLHAAAREAAERGDAVTLFELEGHRIGC